MWFDLLVKLQGIILLAQASIQKDFLSRYQDRQRELQTEGCEQATRTNTSGGWHPPPVDHKYLDSDFCNIPKIAFQEWHDDYKGSPVILTGMPASLTFKDICSKRTLIERYGTTEIVLSSANSHSYDKRRKTLSHYIESLEEPVTLANIAGSTWYHFGDNLYDEWTNFTEHYIRPPYIYEREPFFSFGIGASGSGVPFHTHGAVFSEVVYGRKRWWLSKPSMEPQFDPEETSLVWLHKTYPQYKNGSITDNLLECTVGPGEVLFIDHQWWHSTLNIGQTVFISTFL
eukprot:m.148489 g.148489  ORF g.148489 m.148489 type:complete len:286 (-) comp14999_c0_seq4:215-1072(-)